MPSPPPSHTVPEKVLAPRTTELEFSGFPGALFITITVPLTMYYLTFGCNETMGCALSLPISEPRAFLAYTVKYFVSSFTDGTAWALYFAWYAYCVLAWYLLPGKWVQGLPLRIGGQLEYKTNGMYNL